MIICVCYAVTSEDIMDLLDNDIDTFDEVVSLLGVSTGCGLCERQIREMIDRYRRSSFHGLSVDTVGNSIVTNSPVSPGDE